MNKEIKKEIDTRKGTVSVCKAGRLKKILQKDSHE
jgi:hypothetical protein